MRRATEWLFGHIEEWTWWAVMVASVLLIAGFLTGRLP